MNKYQEALELVKEFSSPDGYNYNDYEKVSNALDTLQELNEKFEKVCLELQNTHFMDAQCKLMTLDIIEGIIRGR